MNKYHQISFVPSTDKMDISGDWNTFYPSAWKEFKESLGGITFVDVTDKNHRFWQNDHDTAVFILDLHWHKHFHIEPLALVTAVKRVHVDEFDYVKIDDHKYIIRMWWD